MPTLVTSIYDLAKRGASQHRTIDWMFAHSAYVMEMPHQLAVFCDPELAAEVKKRRDDRPTVIFDIPFEDLYSHTYRAGLEMARLQENASKTKVTPTYVELMWAKYSMIGATIAELPDEPKTIGWIDFSITHVAKPAPYSIFSGDYSAGIRAHTMRLFNAETVRHPDYWKHVHGHLSGGLVIGAAPAMFQLVGEFFLAAAKALVHGRAVLDEGLLSYVAGTRPELFTLSYGDYEDILRNHDQIRGGHPHLRWMLATGIADHQDTTKLTEAMRLADGDR